MWEWQGWGSMGKGCLGGCEKVQEPSRGLLLPLVCLPAVPSQILMHIVASLLLCTATQRCPPILCARCFWRWVWDRVFI